jgi:hypothetical protein
VKQEQSSRISESKHVFSALALALAVFGVTPVSFAQAIHRVPQDFRESDYWTWAEVLSRTIPQVRFAERPIYEAALAGVVTEEFPGNRKGISRPVDRCVVLFSAHPGCKSNQGFLSFARAADATQYTSNVGAQEGSAITGNQ